MTLKETAAVMAILETAYPSFYRDKGREERTMAAHLWRDILEDYPVGRVLAAVKALIHSDAKGFPPVPGQVVAKLRQLEPRREDTELEAWQRVRRAVSNSIYESREEFRRLPEEVRRVIHDPAVLREWATLPVDELDTVVASNFQRSYRAVAQRSKELDALPASIRQALADAGENLALEACLMGGGQSG